MRFFEFKELQETVELVFEAPADELIPILQKMGYSEIKRDSGKLVIVKVPNKDRKLTVSNLLKNLPGATHDLNRGGSLGTIIYQGSGIQVKPAGGQGDESAGVKNEVELVTAITRFIEERGPLSITFVDSRGKSVTAHNVTSADHVGSKSSDRRKSDVNLMSNNKPVPFSIKKLSSEFWESADSYYGKQADDIIDKLVAAKKITLTPIERYRKGDNVQIVRISPEVAIKATPEQTADVVFGSDILTGAGAVIKQTFQDEHYTIHNNQLTITCDLVIDEPEDIPENMMVYFHIRNDKTRSRPGSNYPGLRIIASYASRVTKALVVDPKTL